MTRKALLVLLATIGALVALASTPALGQITGSDGDTEAASGAASVAATPHQQNLQAIMDVRVARSLAGSPAEPNANQLATAGVALALVAVQITLRRTLRRRNAAR